MRTKIYTILAVLAMVFGLVGCNYAALSQKPFENVERDYKALGQTRHYGGTLNFKDDYFCAIYDENGLDKVSIYNNDKDLPYKCVEIANVQEGDIIAFDLITTNMQGFKEFYHYEYRINDMKESFVKVSTATCNNVVSLDKKDSKTFVVLFKS